MSDQALRPEAISMNSFIEEENPKAELTPEESILAAGSDKIFWKTLHKHFDDAIAQLEQINEQAIASGLPFDEIGRNALVISQVKGILKKIINGVEDAREARDNREARDGRQK